MDNVRENRGAMSYLVFNVESRDPRVLVQSHGASNVEWSAETGICIGDDGEIGMHRDHASHLEELGLGHDGEVGFGAERARGTAAGQVQKVKPELACNTC